MGALEHACSERSLAPTFTFKYLVAAGQHYHLSVGSIQKLNENAQSHLPVFGVKVTRNTSKHFAVYKQAFRKLLFSDFHTVF